MTTRKICLTAMGTALFVVLSLCLQVPVFENYYLCLGYVVIMVFCCHFGMFSSVTVGALGVVLYCLLISGLRGMPGWAAGNVVIGIVMSLAFRYTRKIRSISLRYGLLLAAIILSCAAGILGMKSLVETVLYAQPIVLRMAKNMSAFIADVVVMAVSLPLCGSLTGFLRKLFPAETYCS